MARLAGTAAIPLPKWMAAGTSIGVLACISGSGAPAVIHADGARPGQGQVKDTSGKRGNRQGRSNRRSSELAGKRLNSRNPPQVLWCVRIPVAVLQNPRVFWGFVVLGVARHSVRHSRCHFGWRQERVETLSCRVLAAWHEVSVAVPRLADIAVAGPGGDLLPVETGGDEVRDGAVTCFMGSQWFKSGCLPRLVRSGSDRGCEERLGRCAAEDEVATLTPCPRLVAHEFSSDDERHRNRAATGAGLDVDRSLDRIP